MVNISGKMIALVNQSIDGRVGIKHLGRWESLEMVQRYIRSVTFRDSLRFYKAPLSFKLH